MNRPNENVGFSEALRKIVRQAEAVKRVFFDPEMVSVLMRAQVESKVAAGV